MIDNRLYKVVDFIYKLLVLNFAFFFGTQCGCLCGTAGNGLEFQIAENGLQVFSGDVLDVDAGDARGGKLFQTVGSATGDLKTELA